MNELKIVRFSKKSPFYIIKFIFQNVLVQDVFVHVLNVLVFVVELYGRLNVCIAFKVTSE